MTPPEPPGPTPDLTGPAREVGAAFAGLDLTLATAESCTGGMVAAALSSIPGSSAYFLGGIVAYANPVKVALLGVSETVLHAHGAVSAETAMAMAEGARDRLGADIAVSVTGIAGPSGGTATKPVGLVYLGLADPGGTRADAHQWRGGRGAIRRSAAAAALAAVVAAARGGTGEMPRVAGESRPPPEPTRQDVVPDVRAAFSGDGEIAPLTFRWQGRDQAVAQVGGEGRAGGRRVFTVMTPEARMFELELDPRTLIWSVRPVGPTAI